VTRDSDAARQRRYRLHRRGDHSQCRPQHCPLAGSAATGDMRELSPGGEGVRCEIAWLLIRDNAGRRWEVRPGIARRAKRIRWYHRPKEFQPLLWFSPLMRRFLVIRSKVRLTSDQ
jgi:hypothetical protein